MMIAAGAMGLVADLLFRMLPFQNFAAAFAVGTASLPVYVCVEAVWPNSVGSAVGRFILNTGVVSRSL